MIQQSTSGYIPKRIQSKGLNRYLYTTIQSSQNMETTQMFIHWRMNEQMSVHMQWNITQP